MTECVTKVRLFVSSPSDVHRERDSLPAVIDEINSTIGQRLGFVIELVRWETHCHPAMGRPQSVINNQIGKYDIFIGIMWKRFGTPTGEADSGTEEEFNLAYDEWRRAGEPHIAFYFSQAKYKLNSPEEIEQAAKVLTFQSELATKGLTWKYASATTFADTVRPHIVKILFQMFQTPMGAEPAKGILQTLEGVQKQLDQASEHHRLVINTAGEFTVQEKHSGAAEEEPLKISARFEFPKTPEGRRMREKFQRSLRTGELLTIPKKYIKYVKFPEAFSPLVKNVQTESLTIGGAVTLPTVLLDLNLKDDRGEVIILNNVEFHTSRPAVDKIVLSNEKQPVPWKFTLTLNLLEGTLLFNYAVDFRGLTAKRELDAMQFTNAFARGGTLELIHVDTGFVFQTVNVVPGVIPSIDPNLLRLIEKAAIIQDKARVPIVVPESSANDNGGISADDANLVLETAQKLETGRAILEVEHWETQVNVDLAKKLLKLFEDGKAQSLSFSFEDEVVNIFGAEVHLGLVVMTCERTIMAEKDLKALRHAVTRNGIAIPVKFRPLQDTPMFAHYPAWLPKEEGDFLLTQMEAAKKQRTNGSSNMSPNDIPVSKVAANQLDSMPGVLSDRDEGIAEARRRDAEIDADPNQAITLAQLDSQIKNRRS